MLAYLMVSESVKYIIQVSILLFVHEIIFFQSYQAKILMKKLIMTAHSIFFQQYLVFEVSVNLESVQP